MTQRQCSVQFFLKSPNFKNNLKIRNFLYKIISIFLNIIKILQTFLTYDQELLWDHSFHPFFFMSILIQGWTKVFIHSKAVFTSECKQNANEECKNEVNVWCRHVTETRQTAFSCATFSKQLNPIHRLLVLREEFTYNTFRWMFYSLLPRTPNRVPYILPCLASTYRICIHIQM